MFEKKKITDIYSAQENLELIYKYIEEFRQKFKSDDYQIIRTPGRVNLIGEHTDYNNLPVFPAAIEKEIYIIFQKRKDNEIHIKSFMDRFPARTFKIENSIPPFEQGDWGNYVKAGIQTIVDMNYKNLKGFNALIAGNIPAGSGLSSSSALVVSSASAFIVANDITVDKHLLAEKLAEGEKYVGTAGGGMDQTAVLFGRQNNAIKIDFNPLKIENIPIPSGYDIIIAHSLTVAEKSKGAMDEFNLRSMESKISTAYLSLTIQKEYGEKYKIKFLGDLKKPELKKIKENINDLILKTFTKEIYTISDISEKLNLKTEKDLKQFFTLKNGTLFPYEKYNYNLKKRITHIITEWQRVERSKQFLLNENMIGFGDMMDESHLSCKNNYEISREEIDRLVEIEKQAGAIGARITGAGFGGSTVAVIETSKSLDFIEEIKNNYYKTYFKEKYPEKYEKIKNFDDIIFKTKATDGTCIVRDK